MDAILSFIVVLIFLFIFLRPLFKSKKRKGNKYQRTETPTHTRKPTYQEEKGKQGEDIVSSLLSTLDSDYYSVLNDVLLEREDKTTYQIDHIVFSRKGIFIIETKHWAGFIHGDHQDKTWTQYIGKEQFSRKNPLHQNYGKVEEIRKVFKWESSSNKIKNIVVFTEDNVDLKRLKLDGLSKSRKVLKKEALLDEINQYSKFVFTEKQRKFFIREIKNLELEKTPENLKRHIDFANLQALKDS